MTRDDQRLSKWLRKILHTRDYQLCSIPADASLRRYYRLSLAGSDYIIMDIPPQYSDGALFLDITRRLQRCEINIPIIWKQDIEQGLLLMSDVGKHTYFEVLSEENADQLYENAIIAMSQYQRNADKTDLSAYDATLLKSEIALFEQWLLDKMLAYQLGRHTQESLQQIYALLIDNACEQPQTFVHRDYHSRNLLVGRNNPGIIDYQDAVYGPISYDLVSLLKDCYIKWPRQRVQKWLEFYLETMADSGLTLQPKQFQRWFDFMGIQRHLKASGIFARLALRDRKHGFLKEIPRTLSYIVELEDRYPELSVLFDVLNQILPNLFQQLCTQ